MESAFRMPERFNFDGTDVARRWAKWRKSFETYFTAAELSKKTAAVQVAILLNAAGDEAQEIHSQLVFADTEDKDDVKTVLDKFTIVVRERTLYLKGINSGREFTWKMNQLTNGSRI